MFGSNNSKDRVTIFLSNSHYKALKCRPVNTTSIGKIRQPRGAFKAQYPDGLLDFTVRYGILKVILCG
jgi:hypothetical protein